MSNCVYKITNLITKKCYIGSTNNFQRRMREHKAFFNCAPDRKGYNNPLYRSFRKYGLNNFSFEILFDNLNSLEEARQLEEEQILYYNSVVPNGYNIKSTTEGMCEEDIHHMIEKLGTKCALVDENENILQSFVSLREAGRILNLNSETIALVCKGEQYNTKGKFFRYLNNENNIIEIEPKYSLKHIYKICGISVNDPTNIVIYDNIKLASKNENISETVIFACIRGDINHSVCNEKVWRKYLDGIIIENNIPVSEAINKYNKKYIKYNNDKKTLSGWCKYYNLPYDKVRYQIKYKNRKFEDVIKDYKII